MPRCPSCDNKFSISQDFCRNCGEDLTNINEDPEYIMKSSEREIKEQGITLSDWSTVSPVKVTGDLRGFPDIAQHISDVHIEHMLSLTPSNAIRYASVEGTGVSFGNNTNSVIFLKDELRLVGENGLMMSQPYSTIDFLMYDPDDREFTIGFGSAYHTYGIGSVEEDETIDICMNFLRDKVREANSLE